jgi:hypothetical protein
MVLWLDGHLTDEHFLTANFFEVASHAAESIQKLQCPLLTQIGHFAFIQLCSRSIQLALELSGRGPSQTISQSTTCKPVDQMTDAGIIART